MYIKGKTKDTLKSFKRICIDPTIKIGCLSMGYEY